MLNDAYAVDPKDRTVNSIIQSLGLLLFTFMLGFWAYNCRLVLYKLEKYRITSMLFFYIMSFCLIIAAIGEYALQYTVLFPNLWVIICVELRASSYVAVGFCLQLTLTEVLFAFRGSLTVKLQTWFRFICIVLCISIQSAYVISVYCCFKGGE